MPCLQQPKPALPNYGPFPAPTSTPSATPEPHSPGDGRRRWRRRYHQPKFVSFGLSTDLMASITACFLEEMVIGLGKVYEVIKRVPVVPDVLESNHTLQAPLQQDSGGDVCAVPALKLLVNNIRYLTLRDGPGMTRTERQTQGHRRRWSFPGNARGAASGSGRHLLQQGQSFGGPT
ncbi:hypothetical protein quinque_011623 [Culex quinquefasciatus]